MQQTLSPALSRKLANMGLVCACLVVAIHVGLPEPEGVGWWVARLLREGICKIAVPFFFVAAGFFLAGHTDEPGWWPREMGKRVRSLLVPYVLWSALWTLYATPFTLMANVLAGAPWARNLPLTGGECLAIFGFDLCDYPRLIPLWFVRCLLLLVTLSPLSVAVTRRGRGWGLALLAALWVVYGWGRTWGVVEGTPRQFWWVTLSLEGLFYFTLGLFLRRWPTTRRLPTWCVWCALAAAFGCFAVTIAAANGLLPGAFQACNLGTALGLWAVWRLMPSAVWPRWLTGAAFPLFLTHMFALMLLSIAASNLPFLPKPEEGLFGYLSFTGTAIVSGIAGTWVLRRLFPRTAGLLFGGR